MLVSSREEHLRAAKEEGWVTCRVRPKNAPRGNVSTHYTVEAVPDVRQVLDEINGISYSAVMSSR
jgi:FMN phosphatase YigB (HAD superfamily)